MSQKLYPFSLKKNQHNIELAYNRLFNLMRDAELEGDYVLAEKYEAAFERISNVYDEIMGYFPNCYGVIMIPGKLLSEAKEISFLAEQIRDGLIMQYK